MRLGILTVRKKKAGLMQKLRQTVAVKEEFVTNVRVLAAEYAYTADELKKMPRWLLWCLRRYGMRFMKKQKMDAAVMTIECAAAFSCPVYGGADTINRKIRTEEWEICLKDFFATMQPEPKKWVAWIFDRECRAVSDRLLARLCAYVQRICMVTERVERAQPLCDRLCEEYGLEPEVYPAYHRVLAEHVLIIDMDRGCIRCDDAVFASGAEETLALSGYRVDLAALLQDCPAFYDALSFQGWAAELQKSEEGFETGKTKAANKTAKYAGM